MKVTFKVHRYDPDGENKDKHQLYEIDAPEKATILDSLVQIREQQDSTLAFRGNCRSGFCGDCTMQVNGKRRISCLTTVGDSIKDDQIVVDPIRMINVSKDLVYDVDTMVYKKYAAVEPWIEPHESKPTKENLLSNETMKELRKVMSCTMCWLCDEGCTSLVVDKQFLGPAALTKAYRIVADPRDSRTHERLHKLSEAKGIWDCCHCFEATEHCPKGIDPTARIFALRDKAIKIGAGTKTVKNHYKSFAASVKSHGWLDEARLAIDTEGGPLNILGQLKLLPLAIKAFIRGKRPMPYFLHPKRPGADKIKIIFEKWESKK